jgi:hypothetical protein
MEKNKKMTEMELRVMKVKQQRKKKRQIRMNECVY